MRPVVDEKTVTNIVELTEDEFAVPEEHVKFRHRLDVMIEMIEDLEETVEELEGENERLKQTLEQTRQGQQQQNVSDERKRQMKRELEGSNDKPAKPW